MPEQKPDIYPPSIIDPLNPGGIPSPTEGATNAIEKCQRIASELGDLVDKLDPAKPGADATVYHAKMGPVADDPPPRGLMKVLLVVCDDVNERTLREFLRLGCYQFSTAYVQQESEPPGVDPPGEKEL